MLTPGKIKIAVGRIVKTHGIKGELNVELTEAAEPDEDFKAGRAVILEIDGLDVPFFIGAVRPRGSESLLLQFDDVDSEREAAPLVGHEIFIYADPDEAEGMTAGDLVGFALTDAATGATLGTIEELVELTPGAWYFRLDGNRLIPAVDEFIVDVDPDSHIVAASLPDGILEL